MTTKTLRGFNFLGLNRRNKDAGEFARQPAAKNTAVAQQDAKPQTALDAQGHYRNSFQAEGQVNRDYKKTYSRGDTSDLFTPNATPSKAGSLLGMLPSVSKEGSFSKSVAGISRAGSFGAPGGLAQGQGSYSVAQASVSGQGRIGIEGGALKATGSVEASATLLAAQGSIRVGKGDYTLDASGEAYVGAKAKANGELTIDPARGIYAAKVGGEAFVGARAGVDANVNLGKFGGAGVRAEAWAGAGVALNAELGFKGGRFKARLDIGAALGIGFKLGFNIDIDVKGIKDAVVNVVKAPLEAVKDMAQGVGKALKKLKFW